MIDDVLYLMIDDQDQDHDTAQDHGPDSQGYPFGYDAKCSGWAPQEQQQKLNLPGAVYSHPANL